MDARKIIFGLMVLAFIALQLIPIKTIPLEKRCLVDDDCVFVRTVCCPGCEGGIDSIAKKNAEIMNLKMEKECGEVECPPLFCDSMYGESYTLKPACINNICSQRAELSCSAYCAYYTKRNSETFALYVYYTSLNENLTAKALAEKCGC